MNGKAWYKHPRTKHTHTPHTHPTHTPHTPHTHPTHTTHTPHTHHTHTTHTPHTHTPHTHTPHTHHTHAHTHPRTHSRTHARMHAHTHTRTHAHTHTRTHTPTTHTHTTHTQTCLSFSVFSFDITMRLWVVHMIKHGKIHAHYIYIYTHMYVLSTAKLIHPDSLLAPIAPSEIPRSRRRPPEKTPLAASGAGQTPRVVAATNNEAALRDIPRILLLLYDWLLGIF